MDDLLRDQRHLKLLNGNVLGIKDRDAFGRALAEDARRVTDDELDQLLDDDWRSQIVAAWMIGLTHRVRYRERLGEMLLASRRVYAGQGFCFALTRFGSPQDVKILAAYLDQHLVSSDVKDQPWALGALMYLDTWLKSQEAARFLDGPWQRWAGDEPPMEPETLLHITTGLCVFAEQSMRSR
jgi:hypothetical protein